MLDRVYRAHGRFCANHPWEVIIATLTLAVCISSVGNSIKLNSSSTPHKSFTSPPDDYHLIDIVVMTVIRCFAVLYCYYQFRKLQKLGSKYILGIAALFTIFSGCVFSSSVINFLQSEISDLKDAIFFFVMLIDLSKTTLLAQYALSSPNLEEVKQNIANGLCVVGPALTLDTVVETLVISIGTLSGIKRLEILCYFACLSVVVHYIIFMTVYPACLSLILELSQPDSLVEILQLNKLLLQVLKEEDQKPNPVLQRVKIIMSGGLVVVHLCSHWAVTDLEIDTVSPLKPVRGTHIPIDDSGNMFIQGYLYLVSLSVDQILVHLLVFAVTIKFIFFEASDLISGSQKLKFEIFQSTSVKKVDHTEPLIKTYNQSDSLSISEVQVTNSTILVNHTDNKVEGLTQSCQVSHSHECNTINVPEVDVSCTAEVTPARSLEECKKIYKIHNSVDLLKDEEIKLLIRNHVILLYQLEKVVKNCERVIKLRRSIISEDCNSVEAFCDLPFEHYDYSRVLNVCCENVVGYMPVPVGMAGPLLLDGHKVYVPMATTEGCLVASTNRGCKALSRNGVTSRVVADGMSRGPIARFPSISRAADALLWIQRYNNFLVLKTAFDSTSRFARLQKLKGRIAGRYLFLRFVATTGDAMGMNMLSKGTEVAMTELKLHFDDMELLSLSGNFCCDKKPAAINWIEGRGKSVLCEAVVPGDYINKVLKTTVHDLVDVNISKNLIGSAMAGSIGGFNAHAANIVTAIYIATGQDTAQNVASSNCMTLMEPWGTGGEDLYMTCTMPSLELGTVGGGTQLPAQASCLQVLGVRGSHPSVPGENANALARIVCACVLAGELSLMSALSSGHLVKSHLRYNRSAVSVKSHV